MSNPHTAPVDDGSGHLQCPFCTSYEIDRMFLASMRLDTCECRSCGARWDEEAGTGSFRGRASRVGPVR